jgi:hypothetical protein
MKRQAMLGKKISLYGQKIKMRPTVTLRNKAEQKTTEKLKFWPETKDDTNG